MTWVVGMPTIIGGSVGLSDVRVTLQPNDGGPAIEFDGVQKIFGIGHFIALAFSGSIQIGFAMVQALARLLQPPGWQEEAWDPLEVAKWWPSDAQAIYAGFPEPQRRGGCSLMMLSASPVQDRGAPQFPKSFVHVFRAPDFTPVAYEIQEPVAIGSGSQVEPFKAALRSLAKDEGEKLTTLIKVEATVSGAAMLGVLGEDLRRLVDEHRPDGISTHFHMCYVSRAGVVMGPNDFTRHSDPPFEFRMPHVAKTWPELAEMMKSRGLFAEDSIAIALFTLQALTQCNNCTNNPNNWAPFDGSTRSRGLFQTAAVAVSYTFNGGTQGQLFDFSLGDNNPVFPDLQGFDSHTMTNQTLKGNFDVPFIIEGHSVSPLPAADAYLDPRGASSNAPYAATICEDNFFENIPVVSIAGYSLDVPPEPGTVNDSVTGITLGSPQGSWTEVYLLPGGSIAPAHFVLKVR